MIDTPRMHRSGTTARRTATRAASDPRPDVPPSAPSDARTILCLVLGLVLGVVLGGCDWVDSTGRQSGGGGTTLRLDDTAPGGAIALDEDSETRLEASGAAGGAELIWSDASLEEGALDTCAALDDFRTDIAAASFAEACTDPGDCRFEPVLAADEAESGDDGTGGTDPSATNSTAFVLRVPRLKAPVGVRRELTVTTASGQSTANAYDFCLISINEAPEALDDGLYVLSEGETLVVPGGALESLLANDRDDEDAANRPLEIDPTPRRAPTSSRAFSLGSDGGFSYTAPEGGIIDFIGDSFEYAVSDGSNVSTATARLRIDAGNGAPFLASEPPPLEATAGEPFEIELGDFFADPEDDPLFFSVSGDGLPPSGSLALSPAGVLAGTPIEDDVGDYTLTVAASDGAREIRTPVSLTVLSAPNEPPEYIDGSIDDVLVGVRRSIDPQTPLFVDPDGDPLVFELVGTVPNGIELDPDTGTLSGRPRQRGLFRGLFIRATDPDGESARSETFTLRVF